MIQQPATIRIKNLRLRAIVGIKTEEKEHPQDIIINATIKCSASAAVTDNDIDSALNYRTICKALIRYAEQNTFELLEHMTYQALCLVMDHTQVLEAQVEIDKVGALRYADSVSISMSGQRPAAGEPWC